MKRGKILSLIFVAAFAMSSFAGCWKDKGELKKPKDEASVGEVIGNENNGFVTDGDGNKLEKDKLHTLPKTMVFDGGVSALSSTDSPSAQASYQYLNVEVTVTPSYATRQEIDWSVEWVADSDEWITDKTVTDYVDIIPTSDGSNKAQVRCYGAFNGQVTIKAQSRAHTDIYDTCTVAYAQRVLKHTIELYGTNDSDIPWSVTVDLLNDSSVTFKPSHSILSTKTNISRGFYLRNYTYETSLGSARKLTDNVTLVPVAENLYKLGIEAGLPFIADKELIGYSTDIPKRVIGASGSIRSSTILVSGMFSFEENNLHSTNSVLDESDMYDLYQWVQENPTLNLFELKVEDKHGLTGLADEGIIRTIPVYLDLSEFYFAVEAVEGLSYDGSLTGVF